MTPITETQSAEETRTQASGKFASLFRRIPSYPTLNPLSTAVLFGLPASLGSGISIYYHGALGWCGLELLARGRRFSRDRLMWVATGLLALYCAANVAGFLLNGVPGGSADDLLQLITLLGLPFVYSILALSHKDTIAFAAVAGSAVASYVAGAYALFQFYAWHMRAEGLDGNALVFAHVVTLAGCVCIAGLLLGYGEWRGFRLRGVLIGAIIACLVALALSESRAYWLVFPFSACCVVLLCRNKGWQLGWRSAVAAIFVVVALAAIAYRPVVSRFAALGRDWHKIAGDGQYDNSLGFRVKLWELAAKLIPEHPVVGFGTPSSQPLIEAGFRKIPELQMGFTHFHNGFLTALVEAGAIGLFAILGVLAVAAAGALIGFRRNSSAAQKLGGTILLFIVLASLLAGNLTILVGHDILDATLMVCLVVGLYLAVGTSALEGEYRNDVAQR